MEVPLKIFIPIFIFTIMIGFFNKNPIIVNSENTKDAEILKSQDLTRQEIIKERNRKTANINITIKGVKGRSGLMRIALFNGGSGFPSDPHLATKTTSIKIQGSNVFYSFEDMPFGEYAISVIQDENQNEKIDTGMFGIPTEKYGFSNNPKINFGPPSFSECRFTLGKQHTQLTINLN